MNYCPSFRWAPALALLLSFQLMTSASVPPAAAQEFFEPLREFPGAVLVPPAEFQPFAELPLSGVDWPLPDYLGGAKGYAASYGELGGDGASVWGFVGRADSEFPAFPRCAPDAGYCTENILGRDDTRPAEEVFRGLGVGGVPATVVHITCCNGIYWRVVWHDEQADMTYKLELDLAVAARYGETISPSNIEAARELAAMAEQLVPLR